MNQINRASSLGIRVSFGFLARQANLQDARVVSAITKSGGVYSTILNEGSSRNYINLVLVNGITKNDNPSGTSDILLAGLFSTHFISGSQTQTIKYAARKNETIVFTVQNTNATTLGVDFVVSGKTVKNITVATLRKGTANVTLPENGQIDIKVTASSTGQDSVYAVGAESDMPTQNCTVAVKGNALSPGAKAGVAIGVIGAVGLIGVGLLFLCWKYLPSLFQTLIPAKLLPAVLAPPPAAPPCPLAPRSRDWGTIG